MEYSIRWREEPWLLELTLIGDPTPDEYAAMVAEQMRYLDGANGRLYWLTDLRNVGPEHGHPIDPGVMAQLTHAPTITHVNGGQNALVCRSVFMRFLLALVAQSPKNQSPGGVPIRMFNTLEEAEVFCREVGEVDNKRATACTPKSP